jgi:hypothetical protein
MDAKSNMTRETQQQAVLDLYNATTRTADVPTLDKQTARDLLQIDVVAIHFLATACRTLELDVCGIAIDRYDVNAAVNGNHLNPRSGWETKASIDSIVLLISGRTNG